MDGRPGHVEHQVDVGAHPRRHPQVSRCPRAQHSARIIFQCFSDEEKKHPLRFPNPKAYKFAEEVC